MEEEKGTNEGKKPKKISKERKKIKTLKRNGLKK